MMLRAAKAIAGGGFPPRWHRDWPASLQGDYMMTVFVYTLMLVAYTFMVINEGGDFIDRFRRKK